MSARVKTVSNSRVTAHLARLDATALSSGVTQRKAQGSHYTPSALVEFVVRETLHELAVEPRNVLDPSCGNGNFLVAAAVAIVALGERTMAEVLERAVFGVDIDSGAIELCRAELLALLPTDTLPTTRTRVKRALASHIRCADAFTIDLRAFSGSDGFDLVLGNPPFLNQLATATAATRARAALIARLTDGAVRRYADLAAAFLHVALAATRAHGRLGCVMPQSYLASSDAKGARDAALARASLRLVWSCRETLFADASVRVCAVVLERDGVNNAAKDRVVRCAFGADFQPSPSCQQPTTNDPTWSHLLAEGFGAPACVASLHSRATLDSIAFATADFRDQYYGLRGAIVDREHAVDATHPKLLTTKYVELAESTWGCVDAKILGAIFRHPRVDRATLERELKLSAWIASRLVPKVLVATQTRVIEAFVDEEGGVLPLVPLLTVTARNSADIWMVAAAVASPIIAARAVALYSGSAMSAGAIKLSAKQLLAMPLPSVEPAWRESAREFEAASRATDHATREQHLRSFACASCLAHALNERDITAVMTFWNDRRAGKIKQ